MARNDFKDLATGGLGNFEDEEQKENAYPGWTKEDFQTICDIMDIVIASELVNHQLAIEFVKMFYQKRIELRKEIGEKDLLNLPPKDSYDIIRKVIPQEK